MTQCAKIIVGFVANVGSVFLSNVYKRFFYFLHVFTFLTFFIFISTFITSMLQTAELQDYSRPRSTASTRSDSAETSFITPGA